jgi:hypothetical protein
MPIINTEEFLRAHLDKHEKEGDVENALLIEKHLAAITGETLELKLVTYTLTDLPKHLGQVLIASDDNKIKLTAGDDYKLDLITIPNIDIDFAELLNQELIRKDNEDNLLKLDLITTPKTDFAEFLKPELILNPLLQNIDDNNAANHLINNYQGGADGVSFNVKDLQEYSSDVMPSGVNSSEGFVSEL